MARSNRRVQRTIGVMWLASAPSLALAQTAKSAPSDMPLAPAAVTTLAVQHEPAAPHEVAAPDERGASHVPAPTIVAPELAQGSTYGLPRATVPRREATYPKLPPPDEDPVVESTWYGWQTLVSDAASIAALVSGIGLDNSVIGVAGVGGYLFGAPIVHWYHGAIGTGFSSLGIRVGASALLVLGTGLCVSGALSNDDTTCALMIVGGVAVPAAIAIDAAVFGWEETTSESAVPYVSPWFSAGRRAAGVVWSGTF
jgi:hypothetical protein